MTKYIKHHLFAFFICVIAHLTTQQTFAQVATYYTFSQSNGTYTPGTSGFIDTTGLPSATPASIFVNSWDDVTAKFRLPFAFTYNGILYPANTGWIGLDSDAWFCFSSTNPTMTGTLGGGSWVTVTDHTGVYLNGNANNNGFAGMNCDLNNQSLTSFTATTSNNSNIITAVSSTANLQIGTRLSGTGIPNGTIVTAIAGTTVTMSANATANGNAVTITPSSSIVVFVRGTAPNRQFVVQWTQAKRFGGTAIDNFNLQMVLNEGGGVANLQTLQVIYGTCSTTQADNLNTQVGLRGADSLDFNARRSATGWNITTAAVNNVDVVSMNPTTVPSSGLTFTWSPCTAAAGNAGAVSGNISICPNTNQTYSIPAANGATNYLWTYSGTGATFTSVTYVPNVTISFAANATAGTLTVTPRNICGNGAASNININLIAVNTSTISYPAASYCVSAAGTISPTITGVLGGTYAVTPSGLTMNASGVITPSSSTIGSYTVNYNYSSNGCALTASTTVRINPNPVVVTSATPASVCAGGNSQLNAAVSGVDNYTVYTISYAALTPSGNATIIWNTGSDDVNSGPIALPFAFNYYGSAVNRINVSTNGWIEMQLNSGLTALTPQTLPSNTTPNNVIAMCWADLYVDPSTNPGASVRYFVNGTTPNRVMVIDYNNLRFLGGTGAQAVTGQIRLYEADNHIEVAIASVNDNGSLINKTLGIENSTGTIGLTPAGRNNAVWNVTNEAWAFYPPTGPFTYSWSPSTYLNNTVINNPTATGVNNTVNYNVLVTNSSTGCFANVPLILTATPPGVAGAITGPGTICPNTSQTYSITAVSGATSYNWSYSGTGATFTASTALPTVTINFSSVATAGNLTVTPVNSCGTGTSSPIRSISFTAVSTATIAYPAGICLNSGIIAVVRTGVAGGSYSISPAAGLSINATNGELNTAGATPGTYTISYAYTSNGCALIASATVVVSSNALSVTATANPTTVCAGGTSQLQATVTNTANYSVQSIAYAALTPSGSPTTLWSTSVDDAFSAAIAMPFAFNFYGNAITQFFVHTNGRIELQTSSGIAATAAQTLPSATTPNNVIALCWADLILDPVSNPGSNIRYFANGAAPNRILIIEYTNLRFIAGTSAQNVTGQIRVYESDNHIEVSIANVNDNSTARNKTLGIENSTGTVGLSPAGRNNAAWNVTNEAWAFYPPSNNYTYSWSPAASLQASNVANPQTVAIAAATTYTVTVTSPSTGCATVSNVTVNLGTAMSGTYTVGAGGNYTTLSAAVNDYNNRCISGPIVFSLISATYTAGETFPISINKNIYQSAVNTLTIRPATGITSTISGSAANATIIRISGDYVTIDGSNNGTTTRNLIIANTNATTPRVLHLGSNGTTPLRNVTIKNTVLKNGNGTAANLLLSDAATIGAAGYFRDITIQNDSINLGFHGIYCIGVNQAGNGKGLLIADNKLNAAGASAINDNGIYIQDLDSVSILRNTIGNFVGSNANNDKGIWLALGVRNAKVGFNRITNLNYTGTNGNASWGIYVSTGRANGNNTIFNNLIANITGDGSNVTNVNNTLSNPCGILLSTNQSGINIFHNTINLYGNTLNKASAISACVRLDTNSIADIRNNIFVNRLGRLASGTVTGIASYGVFAATSAVQFFNLNYNNYHINASTAGLTNYFGRVGNTNSVDLPTWRTNSAREASGTAVMPVFLSDSLHINASSAGNALLSNTAIAIPEINTDFDEQTRNGLNPDMGGDEWIEPNKGSWVGRVSVDWLNPLNWESNVVPDLNTDVIINGGYSFMPTIVTTQAVRDISLSTAVPGNPPLLTLSNGTLQVYRNISRSGGSINGMNGTFQLMGTGSQNIPANLFTNNGLKNLLHSNTHTASGVTLLGPLSIYRSLSFGLASNVPQRFNGGATGFLTLKSTATETAWVGKLTGKTFLGTTTVERYIPTGLNHAKSWQLLSVPVKGSQTIKQAWQDTSTAPNQNRYPGYGTQITSNLPNALALGFDVYTPTGPSMKVYNPNTNTYIGVPSTSTTPIQTKKGYMVFVRGDRGDTTFNGIPHPTTLRTRGTLYTANTEAELPPVDTILPNKFESINNPYASAVEFTNIIYDGPPGIDNAFYVWDPLLAGVYGYGGFQTISATNGDFYPTPGGTLNYPSNVRCTKIQSGQAFLMRGGPLGGTVSFNEDAKIDSSRLVTRQASRYNLLNRKYLNTRLYRIFNGQTVLADGNAVVIHDQFSNSLDQDDAPKLPNGSESIALKNNTQSLVIEARQPFVETDSVFYLLGNLKNASYQLEIAPQGLHDMTLTPFLIDKHLQTATILSLTDTNRILFNAIPNTASAASDRFMVVFRLLQPVPVKITSITAVRKNETSAIVTWEVEQETAINHYELERSADGINFSKISEHAASQTTNHVVYTQLDNAINKSVWFYRVRAVGIDGSFDFSDVVRLNGLNNTTTITVNPNPITDHQIHLQCNYLKTGTYQLKMVNAQGQLMLQRTIMQSQLLQNHQVKLPVAIPSGEYIIIIQDDTGKKISLPVVVKPSL